MYLINVARHPENNDGIFMIASTNHLDQLDPGLSSRPSRFDRKYLFPLPSASERTLYAEHWRTKLKNKPDLKFPRALCSAIAGITQGFSFAYLQEAFVATLLAIAGRKSEAIKRGGGGDEGGDFDDYELWREMKKQVKLLRDDMGTRAHSPVPLDATSSKASLKNASPKEDPSWKDFAAKYEVTGKWVPNSLSPGGWNAVRNGDPSHGLATHSFFKPVLGTITEGRAKDPYSVRNVSGNPLHHGLIPMDPAHRERLTENKSLLKRQGSSGSASE